MIGLAMAGAGAAAGVASSAIQAKAQKDAAEAQRAYLDRVRQENIDLSTRTSREQYEKGLIELNDARAREQMLLASSRSMANMQAMNVFGSDAYQGFAQFVSNTLSGRLPDAIQAQVTGQFRQAQESRGLVGAAASRDESRAWGAYLYGQAQQMLPFARQIAMDPFELVNRAQLEDIGKVQAAQQVATGGLQQYLAAASGAQSIASAQVNPIISSNAQLASQAAFSSASPLAGGLGALSTGLGGLGGLIAGQAKPQVSASNYGQAGGSIGPAYQNSTPFSKYNALYGGQ